MRLFAVMMVVLMFSPCQAFAVDPIPNTPTIAAPQPEFPKTPQYAAIAVSPKTLDYGTSQNLSSQTEAQDAAKKKCANGNSKAMDCQIAVYFYDACGAIAVKPKGDVGLNMGTKSDRGGAYGVDWGKTQSSAERKALKICENKAPSGCRVIKSFCSQ